MTQTSKNVPIECEVKKINIIYLRIYNDVMRNSLCLQKLMQESFKEIRQKRY